MKNDETIKSKKAIVGATLAILVALIGVTYAAFAYVREGVRENEITTGTLILELDDDTADGISIDNAVPLTNDQGLSQAKTYKFVLRNTGTANAQYRISLVDDEEAYRLDECMTNRLPHSNLKAALTTDSSDAKIALLGDTDDVLDEGVLEPGEENTIEYTLRIWIDEKADNSIAGTHFHGKIKLEGIVEGRTDYETGK